MADKIKFKELADEIINEKITSRIKEIEAALIQRKIDIAQSSFFSLIESINAINRSKDEADK